MTMTALLSERSQSARLYVYSSSMFCAIQSTAELSLVSFDHTH
jgi:hypothetical protein